MGRYRHRPLHLFGGVGVLMGAIGFVILTYLTVIWFWGTGIGHRPAPDARRAAHGRRDPVRLARPPLGADHLAARGADGRARAHRAARRRRPALTRRAGPLLRHVRARLPAQRAGDLSASEVRRRRRRAPRLRLGVQSDTSSLSAGSSARRDSLRRSSIWRGGQPIDFDCRHRRLPGPLRHARCSTRRRGTTARLQSARLALRHDRR